MEIEDRVLVFIRYEDPVKKVKKWAIGVLSRDKFEYYKNMILGNYGWTSHTYIKEIQLIKPKFIPAY